jgi:3-methylfumaryl-CoA hydratase
MKYLTRWVGREETAEDVVTQSLVARFRATFDLAGDFPAVADVAPRLIHFCLAQPISLTWDLGEDGHPARGGFLPPVPLPRRMWAGSTITFHGELRIGDEVRRRSRIGNVTVKEGRSGTMCFVTVGHEWRARGKRVIEEEQTIVYRDVASSAGPSAPAPRSDPGPPGNSVTTVEINAPILFRYSALTFNGHRIHYDRPYAVEVERYPALVIHGPLQATLLMNLATRENGGVPPGIFTFRSLAPLFDDRPICLHAGGFEDGGLELWSTHPGGPIAMSAEARWP